MGYITTKTIYPGQKGAINESKIYGDKLVCVRYKYDTELQKNIKTVEIITAIRPIKTIYKLPFNKNVYVKIGREEVRLRQVVKKAGARWDVKKQRWLMRYGDVFNIGLEGRIDE